jgi:prepilin-type processing-associated H-X9-DG protein
MRDVRMIARSRVARIVTMATVAVLGVGLAVTSPAAAAAPARPTVAHIAPGSGLPTGGNVVTVTGSGFGPASTVTFGSVRATRVSVLSSTKLVATAPARRAGDLYVHVTTTRGTSPNAGGNRYRYVTAPAALTVGPGLIASSDVGSPSAISCPTATFCMVADQSGGNAYTYTGTTAGTPVQLFIESLTGVSCSSASFCAVIGGTGGQAKQIRTYNGTSWSSAVSLGTNQISSPSCVSATFCIAVGYDSNGVGSWYRFDGSTWTTTAFGHANATVNYVSCASTTFCEAADTQGHLWNFNGSTWTDQGDVYGSDSIDVRMSCVSATSCVAIDPANDASYFNGTTWTAPASIGSGSGAGAERLSCAASSCLAIGGFDDAYYYNGTSWQHSSVPTAGGDADVSCFTTGHCRVVGQDASQDEVLFTTSDGSAWNNGTLLSLQRGFIDDMSCPSATFCAVTDYYGWVNTYNGTSWGTPTPIDPSAHMTGVSCPSASSCTAVDDAGNAFTYNGTRWSAATSIDSHGLTSISCPNTSFCMAVDSGGANVAFSDGHWHSRRQLLVSGGLSSISCSSTVFCYAVGYGTDADGGPAGGEAVRYAAGWQAAHTIEPGEPLKPVSCTSPSFCMVGTSDRGVKVYTGGAWSADIEMQFDPDGTDGPAVEDVSCVSAQFCHVTYFDGDKDTDSVLDGAAIGASVSSFAGAEVTSCWAVNACVIADGTTTHTLG